MRSKDDRRFLKQLNRLKISYSLFKEAVQTLSDLGDEVYSFENRVITLLTFFQSQGFDMRKCSEYGNAVEFRMQALMSWKADGGVPEWEMTYVGESGNESDDPYLAAAAQEKLLLRGFNEIVFDRERFEARARSNRAGSSRAYQAAHSSR